MRGDEARIRTKTSKGRWLILTFSFFIILLRRCEGRNDEIGLFLYNMEVQVLLHSLHILSPYGDPKQVFVSHFNIFLEDPNVTRLLVILVVSPLLEFTEVSP